MLNFGIRNDHTKVPPQECQQCSHSQQSHCNCNHHHHSGPPSCCVLPSSCCRSSAPPQCCQSKPPSHSIQSCHIPDPPCRPAACPCHGSTKGPASQGYYWRDYIPGEIPHDVVAGIDQKYVGQVSYNDTILPVTIHANKNTAVGERSGRKIFTKNIKILCCADPTNLYWEHVNYAQVTNEQMNHAVKGGHQDNYDLYIGVAYHEREWKIGKVLPKVNLFGQGLHVCNDFGNCVRLWEFHILKYKSNTPRRKARQDFYWRDYIPGEIPHDALKATDDLCIGQVSHSSGNLPATIYTSHNVAITEKNGKQIFRENIKILCSPDASKFYWERCPSTSLNYSGFGSQATAPRFHGSLFGATTQQGSSITGMSQNQTAFGTSNQQGSSITGMSQNQTAFGTSNQQGSSIAGMSQNQTVFGRSNQQGSSTSEMPLNLTTNIFGAQPSQVTTFGTASNQSGGLSSSQQNQMQTVASIQQAFSFGIPQVANSEVQSDKNHIKEETVSENNDLKSSQGISSEIGQINETTTSESSQGGNTTFVNLQTSETVTTHSSMQNQCFSTQNQELTSSGKLTSLDNAGETDQNAKKGEVQVGTGFGNNQATNLITKAPINVSSQAERCQYPQTQGGFAQTETQGTSPIFDQSQTQGISVAFGQPHTQGLSAPSSQPETQNPSSNFTQPQIQGSSVLFGQLQTQGTSGIFGQQQTQGTSIVFGQQQTQDSSVPPGQSQTQGTSALFGQPQTYSASTVFGQQQAQENSALFGRPQTQGSSVPFGQLQTQGGSVPFGQQGTQRISAGFGQPQTQGSSFSFGHSQTQEPSVVGLQQGQGSFTTFSQPQTQGTSALFGQTQPQGSTFGQSQTQGFGGSGCFGNNQRSNFITTAYSFPSWDTDAIRGGHQDGLDLYIGRAFHEGECKIGRVVVNGLNKTLYVWGQFNETVLFAGFEILKYRSN